MDFAPGVFRYVVSGYAARAVTLKEAGRMEVPLPAASQGVAVARDASTAEAPKKNKYAIAAPRKLESGYEKKMKEREAMKKNEAATKADVVAATDKVESRRPEFDELNGLRCHAWVLIVAGKRGVPETFFIESSTGHALSPLDSSFQGIEAVWNSKNFWANMQKCTNGLADMQCVRCSSAPGWVVLRVGGRVGPGRTEFISMTNPPPSTPPPIPGPHH